MRLSTTTTSLLATATIAFAAPQGAPPTKGPATPHVPAQVPAPKNGSRCENPIVRKEWRKLADVEKKEYIDAVLCLQTKKAITKKQFADDDRFNPINRYDDFQAVHSSQADKIHFVGFFAQWHRYMTASYEKTLREVCGYKGAQPYWNWSLDAKPDDRNSTEPFETDIFSPTTGFGGNGEFVELAPGQDIFGFGKFGRSGGGCVQDGPFTRPNFQVNIGEPEGGSCLRRDFTPGVFNFFADPAQLERTLAEPTFNDFAHTLEGAASFAVANIHGSGHFGVGGILGQAGNAANSPGEPLFYLHHAQVDHVYWQWQQKDLAKRLHEVGGQTTPRDTTGPNVTADFKVNLGAIAPSIPISDLLDTEGGVLCYTYE